MCMLCVAAIPCMHSRHIFLSSVVPSPAVASTTASTTPSVSAMAGSLGGIEPVCRHNSAKRWPSARARAAWEMCIFSESTAGRPLTVASSISTDATSSAEVMRQTRHGEICDTSAGLEVNTDRRGEGQERTEEWSEVGRGYLASGRVATVNVCSVIRAVRSLHPSYRSLSGAKSNCDDGNSICMLSTIRRGALTHWHVSAEH